MGLLSDDEKAMAMGVHKHQQGDFIRNVSLNIFAVKFSTFRPLHDSVFVYDMNFGDQKSSGGIIVQSDNGKIHGIHPRWGKIYAVGPEQKDVKVGQWILISHGRWTRGIKIEDATGEKIIRKIDVKEMLLISDEAPPEEVIIGQES